MATRQGCGLVTRIFISHFSEDKRRLWPLIEALLSRRDWTVFFDRPQDLGVDPALYAGRIEPILSGDPWPDSLKNALQQADCIAGFLSEAGNARCVAGGSCEEMVKELAVGLDAIPPKAVIFELDPIAPDTRLWLGEAGERHDVSLDDAQSVQLKGIPDPAGYVIGQIEQRLESKDRTPAAPPLDAIAQAVRTNPAITRLPSLFETNETLPVATAYVELSIAPRGTSAEPHLLEPLETPMQRLHRRETQLRNARRAPRDLLDQQNAPATLIIGGPGTGKSSLLRRIALEIAGGDWAHVRAPLFVELRRYWSAARTEPGLTLLGFALTASMPALLGDDARRRRLEADILNGRATGLILLADGLDEIAGQPDAVERIYGELAALASVLPWITTCRPTGLVRSCGESSRLDMMGLDPEAVETLIRNWSDASGRSAGLADTLIAEISGQPTLRQMAANPFLLTAICFLKSLNQTMPLPGSRIAVYEQLIEQIALQAQRRHGTDTILDAEAVRVLEAFCLDLYTHDSGPRQLFSRGDWARMADPSVDLTRRILPARLITSFSEDDPTFHFLHLSLQEHLLARALQARPDRLALARRFAPAWRAAFRAYGALLHHSGRHDAFRTLTQRLFGERDLQGLTLIGLAEIFADAGIRDTRPWIGADLREILWEIGNEAWNEIEQIALNTHAVLDPEDLELRAMGLVEEIDWYLDSLLEDYPEDFDYARYPNEPYAALGRDESFGPRILARVATPSAYRTLQDLFSGADQRRALSAATAYADVIRPSDRAALADKAGQIATDSDFAFRILAFVEATGFPEFAPFVARMAGDWRGARVLGYGTDTAGLGAAERVQASYSKGSEIFQSCITVLLAIGGRAGAEELARLLEMDIAAWHAAREREADGDETRRLKQELVMWLLRIKHLDPGHHRRVLERLAPRLDDPTLAQSIHFDRAALGLLPDREILQDLAHDEETREQMILTLQNGYVRTRKPLSLAVLARLKRIAPDLTLEERDRLASLETQRIAAGDPPCFEAMMTAEAQASWARFRQAPSEPEFSMLLWRLDSFLGPALAAKDRAVLPLVEEILTDREILLLGEDAGGQGEELYTSMIDAASAILDGSCLPRADDPAQDRFIALFAAAMFDPDFDVAQHAATALGRLSLPRLLDFRGGTVVEVALEELCTEFDLLVFDRFWTSRDGTVRDHTDDRPVVLHLARDDAGLGLSGSMAHALARYGLARIEAERPQQGAGATARPIAILVFDADPEDPDPERAGQAEAALAEFKGADIPILTVPRGLERDEIHAMATDFARRLGKAPIV